jgi:hypothetical protein
MPKAISKDQSAKARAKRLSKGTCPIHGVGFDQIDEEWGGCDWNKECEVRARPIPPPGKTFEEITIHQWCWELAQEYQYLLKGESK